MITDENFLKIIRDNTVIDQSGFSLDDYQAAEQSYELAKQLAIDFMDWKMTQFLEEEDGVFFDQMGEVFAETSEELFNLYLKSQE